MLGVLEFLMAVLRNRCMQLRLRIVPSSELSGCMRVRVEILIICACTLANDYLLNHMSRARMIVWREVIERHQVHLFLCVRSRVVESVHCV